MRDFVLHRVFASLWSSFKSQASRWTLLSAAVIGLTSFAYYYAHGLTVAHYDAKAHLVVARRIVDSLTPGYTQMGVNWLPLTHLLYLPFILVDSQYRTGIVPSMLSVLAFTVSAWLIYRISLRATALTEAGIFAAVLFVANPNLLYIQSCPLTEPLYMVLMLLAVDALQRWRDSRSGSLLWMASLWTALGGMCRYEGWYLFGGIFLLLVYDGWRSRSDVGRRTWWELGRPLLIFAGVFGAAALAHFGYIYWALGDSFMHRVAQGHPSPYVTVKRPFLSILYHWGELAQMAAGIPFAVAVAGVVLCLARPKRFSAWAPLFLLWLPSLINISALFWGLVYRVRYSVLLLPAVAIFGSVLLCGAKATKKTLIVCTVIASVLPASYLCFPHEWKFEPFYPGPGHFVLPFAALALFLTATASGKFGWPLLALSVLSMHLTAVQGERHAMLAETLEHEFIEPERHQVLDYLQRNYDGTRILIDMGKLAPLVYDSQLPVKQFIYNEGQSKYWEQALQAPQRYVGWLCAQSGDEVWAMLRVDPHWADRYSLALQTETFQIYRLRSEDRESLLPVKRFE